jgi:hypothetical protein
MWKLGLRPHNYFSGNICFRYRVFASVNIRIHICGTETIIQYVMCNVLNEFYIFYVLYLIRLEFHLPPHPTPSDLKIESITACEILNGKKLDGSRSFYKFQNSSTLSRQRQNNRLASRLVRFQSHWIHKDLKIGDQNDWHRNANWLIKTTVTAEATW